jgi:hypothetical protein
MASPTFSEDVGDERRKYWRCPVRYIPRSVEQFFAEYDYAKGFPNAPMPPYDELNPRFRQAMFYYERQYMTALEEARKTNGR